MYHYNHILYPVHQCISAHSDECPNGEMQSVAPLTLRVESDVFPQNGHTYTMIMQSSALLAIKCT